LVEAVERVPSEVDVVLITHELKTRVNDGLITIRRHVYLLEGIARYAQSLIVGVSNALLNRM
jgi:hypothetical protein